jgi:hypothetical protein
LKQRYVKLLSKSKYNQAKEEIVKKIREALS